MLTPAHFKLVIDSMVWAFKHTERQISETGLNILLELLKNGLYTLLEPSVLFVCVTVSLSGTSACVY